MLVKSRLNQDIGDKSGVGELVSSDWGQAVALQPVLNGAPLIGVPICSNHRLHHHHLSHHITFATVKSFSLLKHVGLTQFCSRTVREFLMLVSEQRVQCISCD